MQPKSLLLVVLLVITGFGLAGCSNNLEPEEIKSTNLTPSTAIAEAPTPVKSTKSSDELIGFLMNFQDAYCNQKKLMIMYQDAVNSEFYQKLIGNDSSDVPAQRIVATRILGQMRIFDTENKIQMLENSALASDFFEPIRLLRLSDSFINEFFTELQYLQSFPQFKGLTTKLLSAREALSSIEFELGRSYEFLLQDNPNLLISSDQKTVNQSALKINDLCDLSLSTNQGNWFDNQR